MKLKQALQWLALAASAGACVLLLRELRVPGAILLGPMLVAIGFAVGGAGLALPPRLLLPVQAVLGSMVASVVSGDLLRLVADHWMVVLAVNVLGMLAASAIALLFTRRGWLPGQSAIWGLSPGAATTMMMLAEQRGEDPRIVALIQYLRIVLVTVTAIAVAGLVGTQSPPAVTPQHSMFLSGPVPLPVAFTLLGLVVAGIAVAMATKWGQAAFWVPVLAGSALQVSHGAAVEVPVVVAAIALGLGGCHAGLRFNKPLLLSCIQLLPAMLLGIVLMIGSSLALMWPIQSSFAGADALTAFLAIMPGGIDAAVAIAHGMHASVPVIVAVQVMRLLVVTLLAPLLARVVSRFC
jgi:membrane AbrB-like protein